MSSLLFYISIVMIFAGYYVSLNRMNHHRKNRYKNILFPLLAVAWVLLVSYVFIKYYESLKHFVLTELSGIITDELTSKFEMFFDILYCMAAIAIYFFPRITVKAFSQKLIKKPGVAYEYCSENKMSYVKSEWYFSHLFFKYLIWFGLIMLLLSLAAMQFHLVYLPLYAILSLLLCFELFWYFDGLIKPSSPSDSISTEVSISKIQADYDKLCKSYRETWNEKIFLYWQFKSPKPNKITVENLQNEFLKNLSIQSKSLSSDDVQIFEEIEKKRDILISCTCYEDISLLLFAAIYKKLLAGENILFITNKPINDSNNIYEVNIAEWITNSLKQVSQLEHFANAQQLDPTVISEISSNIVVSQADNILANRYYEKKWFYDLQCVVVLSFSDFYRCEISSLNILINLLKDQNQQLQHIVINNLYRESIESSVRSLLKVDGDLVEYRYPSSNSMFTHLLVYKTDTEGIFQSKLLRGYVNKFLGEETSLAVFALKDNITHIKLFGLDGYPATEYIEELDNNRSNFNFDTTSIAKNAFQAFKYTETPHLSHSTDNGVICCRDNFFNLPYSAKMYNAFNKKLSLINIICPPYLLRSYFAHNLHYFYHSPVYAIPPVISKTSFSAAYYLLWKLTSSKLTAQKISELMVSCFENPVNHSDCIAACSKLIFEHIGITNIENHLIADSVYYFNTTRRRYEKQVLYSLGKDILDAKKLEFQKRVIIKTTNGVELGHIQYDFLFQNYLPGQIHEFGGKPYFIGNFDSNNFVNSVSFSSPSEIIRYHNTRKVTINNISLESRIPAAIKTIDNKYRLSVLESAFSVTSTGYFTFNKAIDLHNQPGFTPVSSVPVRNYTSGRMLMIEYWVNGYTTEQKTSLVNTFTVLISELLLSLFPETYRYLFCGSPFADLHLESEVFSYYFGVIDEPDIGNKTNENYIRVYIIEDAHQDLGLIRPIFDRFDSMMLLIDDYLTWKLSSSRTEVTIESSINSNFQMYSDVDDYLHFGHNEISQKIDIELAKKYLSELYNENYLTKDRTDYLLGKKNTILNNESGHYCDFCAAEISSSEIEELSDGRERCANCRNSAIDSDEKLLKVYNEAVELFRNNFKQRLPKGIHFEFTTSDIIHQTLGMSFKPSPDFDARPVGIASENTIMVENGAPYSRTLSTIIHELTHIWQNKNLNVDEMKNDAGLLLIEGHAVWSSIHVLDCLNIAKEYRDHYNYREDEYGQGLKKIQELLKLHRKQNAFELLKEMYPK